jgi:choline kinase
MLRLNQNSKKTRSGQTLHEDVCELEGRQYVQDADIIDDNMFLDELVKVDLNILCTLVLNGVGGEVDGADVIAVDESFLQQ